jgi:regulation of enolase protein 1 (concanavalin A-like superfamily)
MSEQAPASKEEVVVMTGVRARMAAYKEEIKRKEQVKKKHQPRFMVADDLGPSMHSGDKDPVELLENSMSQIDHSERDEESDLKAFDRSMNLSGRHLFGGASNKGILDAGIDAEPEKTQEVKDEEEKEAKETFCQLLGSGEDTEGVEESEPIILQSFARVQRRYMNAVTKLRPTTVAPKKIGKTPEGKEAFKQEVNQEMGKSRHLTALTNHWDDYYEKAQDKDDEPEEVKIVEEELKQVESEVQQEWEEYAEIIVEAVDDVSVMSDDSDMLRWRDEARRLKAEAEERKRQKTIREERRKKRASVAAARKKRAEEAAKRKAEEIARRKAERAEEERLLMEEEAKKPQEEAKKPRAKAEEAAEVSEDSDSDSSVEEENTKVSKRKSKKKKDEASEESDSDSSVEEENTKVSKKKSKKKKDKDKPKDKDKDKKKKSKKKDGKKKTGNDESDLEDGWVEEYPRNLDGTLWKNVLKYWTNKPKKLNEIAPKVIMKPNANSDIFCKTEDQLNDNGCFYWHKFDGDFNVLVKIKANLKTSYDKAGILIRQDERNWVMSGLEFFNKRVNHSSCITRGISDWSLAPLPDEAAKDGIWIAIKRHSNKVECFYSFDLKEWVQTRQGLFPTEDTLKVGIVAACPMGEPFKVVFERFRIQMVG